MSDRRLEILKPFIFKIDERDVVREEDALDAMDEYMRITCLELLVYLAKNDVVCESWEQDDDGEIHCSFRFKRDWISKEQLFENFL